MTDSAVIRGRQNIPEQHKPLSDEAVKARREYFRQYYQRNKDKRKQWNQNHWEKVASKQKEQSED